jgi:hypothetical protein
MMLLLSFLLLHVTLTSSQGQTMQSQTPTAGQTSGAPPVDYCKAKTGRACQNVLYLVSDDMRPQLSSYGHDYMITPHLDGLARTGLQFDFAYTNFAYCAPSRNSFMVSTAGLPLYHQRCCS